MSSLQFENPFWWFIIMALAALALVYYLYWGPRKSDFTSKERRILLAFRWTAFLVLTFLLLRPLLFMQRSKDILPKLYIAVDASASMVAAKDSSQVVKDLRAQIKKMGNELERKFDVHYLHFGEKVSQGLPEAFNQAETDISELLQRVKQLHKPDEIGALVLASDGIFNKGLDPLYYANGLQFPVFTLKVGDSTRYPNLSIEEVFHSPYVFPNTQFEIEVFIEAYQSQGSEFALEILQNNKVLATDKISIRDVSQGFSRKFMLPAGGVGVKKFIARVSPLANEKNTRDNSYEFFVEVIDNRKKILLVSENIHPDLGVIRSLIGASENYELIEKSPAALKNLDEKIDLMVVHSPLSRDILTYYKNKKETALLLIVGFGADKDVLAGLLQWDLGAPLSRANSAHWQNATEFAAFRLNPLLNSVFVGNQYFEVYYNPQNIEKNWQLAAKQKINNIALDRGLLYINNEKPKKAFLNGEGLFRWHMQSRLKYGIQDPVGDFLTQWIQYLTTDVQRKNLDVRGKKEYYENEGVLLDARLFDEAYQSLANQNIEISIKDETGKENKYNFSSLGESYQLRIDDLAEGIYDYTASAQVGTKAYTDRGVFRIVSVGREKLNTLAQHAMLEELALQTGGESFEFNQMQEMSKALLAITEQQRFVKIERKLIDLIELKSLFYIILVVLSAEWALRRYFGMY